MFLNNFISSNTVVDYIISGLAVAVVLIILIVAIVKIIKNNSAKRLEEKKREVGDVVEKHGVRYTPNATIVDEKGNETVSYIQGDIVIKPRKTMHVGKGGEIKPGKWTILSTKDKEATFNVRIGNYVQEYRHGQEIVLADGDDICPTSTTIILR